MRRHYLQWAIVTVKRPTFFLNPEGEITEMLEEAWMGTRVTAEKFRQSLDEPERFELIAVTVSVEV